MTAGHKHRIVKVTRDGLLHRMLTRPTLWTSTDLERVAVHDSSTARSKAYRLSPLGLLHGLTGLTLLPVDRSS